MSLLVSPSSSPHQCRDGGSSLGRMVDRQSARRLPATWLALGLARDDQNKSVNIIDSSRSTSFSIAGIAYCRETYIMYNECDKHQRSLHSRFINPPATEHNSTDLPATQASSRLPLSVTTASCYPETTWPGARSLRSL